MDRRANIFLLAILLLCPTFLWSKNITIIGCGYTGLVLAGVLASNGHTISCIDIDEQKISLLKNKKLPIYEPGLHDLLFAPDNNLFFSDSLKDNPAEIYFICVPTPSTSQGHCDLSFLYHAFSHLIGHITTPEPTIICIKSTVPPGTIRILQNLLIQEKKEFIHLIYNPEFMREGSAINDIYSSNPVVLGGESIEALSTVEALYTDFLTTNNNVIRASFETAEIIKYAWNAFSATRIAFVNELASLCRIYQADINKVIQGMALSTKLLPAASLQPGPGYGGSCLPKDATSLSKIMKDNGLFPSIISQAIQSNEEHKKRVIADIFSFLDTCNEQPIVALLGLSFKEQTNDCRNAPSIDIIQALLDKNVTVNAYDPKATDTVKNLFPTIHYFESPYDAIANADCVVILNAWNEIKEIELSKVALLCRKKIIIDTKNILSPTLLKKYHFTYLNMGRTE
jgi:UDPglucose 6-dehydrogenase